MYKLSTSAIYLCWGDAERVVVLLRQLEPVDHLTSPRPYIRRWYEMRTTALPSSALCSGVVAPPNVSFCPPWDTTTGGPHWMTWIGMSNARDSAWICHVSACPVCTLVLTSGSPPHSAVDSTRWQYSSNWAGVMSPSSVAPGMSSPSTLARNGRKSSWWSRMYFAATRRVW